MISGRGRHRPPGNASARETDGDEDRGATLGNVFRKRGSTSRAELASAYARLAPGS